MSGKNLNPIVWPKIIILEYSDITPKSQMVKLRIYNFVKIHSNENHKETLISPDFELTSK